MRRVLLAERISDDKGERSESVEDQDLKLRTRAVTEGDVTIVGTSVDLSVSGDVDMFVRPKLGKWLEPEGREQWDEIWVTTQDRLSRSEPHFMAFVFWVIKWGKTLIVLDDPSLDLTTPEGRAIAHVKSIGPHKELERIKQRVQDSHDRRRFTNRWTGGIPPFGYRVVHRYEEGKTAAYLELDEDMASELHSMRKEIMGGQTFVGLAKSLNERGVLTARDANRVRKGKPVKARGGDEGTPERWSETSVKNVLTDESSIGLKKHKREIIYGMDGHPIQLAEPVFTADEWESLQAAVKRRTHTKVRRVNGTSPMYGVVHCSQCGSKAVHKVSTLRGVTYRYYQCGAWPKEDRCTGISCRAEAIEEMVEIHFLQKFGNARVTKRVWVPGSDSSKELTDITKRMERLRKQDEEGDWDDDQEGYRFRMNQYKARKRELESKPVVKAGWTEEDQGMTFGELWPKLDLEGKRKQLIESGYKVMVGKKTFAVTPQPDTPEEREAKWESLAPEERERVKAFHTAKASAPLSLTPRA
ncbi:recombinase family protein [Streptomyces sp. ISL-100]|uniref:recombinase family protein n=1 Tax=Streptomyces sp. ISL-100 TaxID=2819173 RepID=UPI001BECC02D|nr:recombinase family protein [Streptomyces sp. ISL-100]MBT2398785.1 recombinase family protein [Streptomyces sp. ISL-100]